jgi:hypothetical protein
MGGFFSLHRTRMSLERLAVAPAVQGYWLLVSGCWQLAISAARGWSTRCLI